jgi:hypothetical protein
VNPLRALLAALTPEAEQHAEHARALAASLKALRGDVQTIRREIGAVAERAEAVGRQVAQVRALQHGSRGTPAGLDALAALIATERVVAHLRAAVERAVRVERPGPRLAIDSFWPADVYEALIDAIPDQVFFDGASAGAQTLRVPPRLAPAAAIATWTFVAEIVEEVVVPAIAARFGDLLDPSSVSGTHSGDTPSGGFDVVPGRLVRRPAGSSAPPASARTAHWGLLVIDLTRPRQAAPATANTALAVFRPAATDVPPAPPEGVRHTYEVWFGSGRDTTA